ncbi:MAG: PEP-CTERM sorting domain-containing protein [Verrucomicrobia bacterium]|nr:PEP-CTERM sorting domain-containing protein [Verrucomicrobiota bacterium]
MKRSSVATLTIIAVILAVASFSVADMILVDFGLVAKRHSLGGADGNGNHWDYITGATDNNSDLVWASDGTGSGANLQMVSGFTGPADYNFGFNPNASLGDFAFTNVTDDAIYFLDSATPQMTLSGLNNSYTYNVTFYGARVTTTIRDTTYSIGSSNVTIRTSGDNIASNGTDDWNDNTTRTIAGISPTSGSIDINLSATGGFGYINAMQIEEVIPEPSTALLLLLGGTGILLRARRRRK